MVIAAGPGRSSQCHQAHQGVTFQDLLLDAEKDTTLKECLPELEAWLIRLDTLKIAMFPYYEALKKTLARKTVDNPKGLAFWFMRDKNYEKLQEQAQIITAHNVKVAERKKSPFIAGRIRCRVCNGDGWYARKPESLTDGEQDYVDFQLKTSGRVAMTSSRGHYAFPCECSETSGPRKEGDGNWLDFEEQMAAREEGQWLRSKGGRKDFNRVLKGMEV